MSSGQSTGKPSRYQPLQLVGAGMIKFGNNVSIGVFPSPLFFSSYAYIEARCSTTIISIEENTWINNNFCAVAHHTSITIGKNCLIGINVEIYDSDFHALKASERRIFKPEWARPVIIGNNVFIGSNAKIMKGVTVGNGAVVANDALVIVDVPSNTLVGGVHAKIIRMIE